MSSQIDAAIMQIKHLAINWETKHILKGKFLHASEYLSKNKHLTSMVGLYMTTRALVGADISLQLFTILLIYLSWLKAWNQMQLHPPLSLL